jgi:hypothetical protein
VGQLSGCASTFKRRARSRREQARGGSAVPCVIAALADVCAFASDTVVSPRRGRAGRLKRRPKETIVGFFGSYLYADGHWQEEELAAEPTAAEPWLHVLVHGSDFTAITYRPAGPGSGVAFLGYTPRSLFETEDASAPTDVVRETAGLANWWAHLHGLTSGEVIAAKSAQLIGYLAEDIDPTTRR